MSRPRKFTDAEIFKAASDIFEESGLKASTESIAKALGISQPALFKRFGTKKELSFRSVLYSLNQNLDGYLLEIIYDDRAFDIQLIERCEKAIAFMQTQMPKIRLMQSMGLGFLKKVIPYEERPPIKHHQKMTEWFNAAIEAKAIEHESAHELATIFLGAMIAHIHIAEFGDPESKSTKHYAELVASTLIQGIRPRSKEPTCS